MNKTRKLTKFQILYIIKTLNIEDNMEKDEIEKLNNKLSEIRIFLRNFQSVKYVDKRNYFKTEKEKYFYICGKIND